MVRTGSRLPPSYAAHNEVSALDLIDDMLEQDQEEYQSVQKVSQAERIGFDQVASTAGQADDGRGRRPSRESLASRKPSQERLSSQERLQSGSGSTGLLGTGRLSRSPSLEALRTSSRQTRDKMYQKYGRMTAQEQAFYSSHGRPLADEEDPRDRKRRDELRKRSNKDWGGRSAWHPLSCLESFWLAVTQRSRWIYILGLILVLALVTGGIVGFFLWPRALSIKFVDIEHDANPEPYRLIPRQHGVRLRLQSWVRVEVTNPNFVFPAKIKKSSVLANWIMFDGREEMFGGSIIDEERVVGKREKAQLRLPITIEYFGTPKDDPIYMDFLERCYEGYGDGTIQLKFLVEITTEAKEIKKTGIINIDRSMACPMGKEQIKKIMDRLYAKQ